MDQALKVGDVVRVLPNRHGADHVGGVWTVTRACKDNTFDLSKGEHWPVCEDWELNVTRTRLELLRACDPAVTFCAYYREWQRRAKPRYDREPWEKADYARGFGPLDKHE